MSLGKGLHNVFEQAAEETIESDGLLFTPDEIVTGSGEPFVVEFKTTRMSASKSLSEMGTYTEQAAGYCAFLGITRARLHVIFLAGNYKPPKPLHHCYDLEFDERELSWWKGEILRRRDLILGAGSLESIPLAEHTDWECNYCPIKGTLCEGGGGQRSPAFPHVEMIEEE